MKKSFLFIIVCQFIVLVHTAFAGWPEDGWYVTSDLDFSHRGVALRLTDVHRELASRERNLARVLPSGNTTNIVLATLGIVVEGKVKLYPILGPNNLSYVFESGWESAFQNNPILNLVESSVNRHVPSQKKDELSSESKLALMNDFENIIRFRSLFQSQIQHCYDFAIGVTMPVDDIIQHGERVLSRLSPEAPIRSDFGKRKRVYKEVETLLKETKKKSRAELVKLSQDLDPELLEDKDFGAIESAVKDYRKDLFKAKKAVTDVGAGIIATYWHSEQRLLHHLSKQAAHILRPILESLSTSPEALILCLHSRFDICKVCSYSLAHSCVLPEDHSSSASTAHSEEGILSQLKRVVSEHFGPSSANFPLFITSSFREERKGFDFNKEAKVELRDSSDLLQRSPAFPMCHIPLEVLPPTDIE